MTLNLFYFLSFVAVFAALLVVFSKNAVYSVLYLIVTFFAIAGHYFLLLDAQFLAAVHVIVYAGAIMVLVVFVIMLLNVEEEERRRPRLKFLVPAAVVLSAVLIAEVAFILVTVQESRVTPVSDSSSVGLTHSIGSELFTRYLLPFEITSILILMAIVGAMTLARRGGLLSSTARIVPGATQIPLSLIDPAVGHESTLGVEAETTEEAARLLGVDRVQEPPKQE